MLLLLYMYERLMETVIIEMKLAYKYEVFLSVAAYVGIATLND